MIRGLVLTIGLNNVDPTHYAGLDGRLNPCEQDAEDMTEIAKSRCFDVNKLYKRRNNKAW